MNYLAFIEWAAANVQEATALVDDYKKLTPPSHGHYVEFVDSSRDFETRLAHLADTFPIEALKNLKSHQIRARIETAHGTLGALGGGHLLENLGKIAQLAQQLWQLYQQFKPA